MAPSRAEPAIGGDIPLPSRPICLCQHLAIDGSKLHVLVDVFVQVLAVVAVTVATQGAEQRYQILLR